ncbi:unnamed protein product [Calypogeia fissa]
MKVRQHAQSGLATHHDLSPEQQFGAQNYDLYGKLQLCDKERDEGAKKGIGRSFWHDGDEGLAMIWLRQLRNQNGKNQISDLGDVNKYTPDRMPSFSQPPNRQGKEEEAINWLKVFLRVAEVYELSENDSFNLAFKVLNGPAFDWLCQEVPLIKKRLAMENWERWSQFLLRFAQCFVIRSGYNMRHQVRLRSQRKKEDVKAYYDALVALAVRIRPPIDDDFFKVEFMLGLRNPSTQQVAKMASALGKSPQEVMEICIEFDNREKRKKLRDQLVSMRQISRESITTYAVNFETLANKMKPRMHDADLVDYFVDGLRDESLRDCVQRNLPKTLAEAIEIALLGCK